MQYRDLILREMTRHEGLKNLRVNENRWPTCTACGDEDGSLICTECYDPGIYCAECICERHATMPLHRIKVR
jgi:hypothetical protein